MELERAWCRETAHPSYQDKWSEDNPSVGQCLVTALIVQERYGGDIYSCKVGNNSHFVNIIDERIIDRTAEQFGGTNVIKYISGSFRKRTRESLLKNKDVKARYELLKARLEELTMEETSIQLTLSENEIKGLEKAVGWAIEDKEDLYQAVIEVVLGRINDYKKAGKPVRMMGYGRFNKETKEISKIVGQLTYDLRTNMTSVTRFVRMERAKHPTLTDGQFLDRYLEYRQLALQAVDNILKCLNNNEKLREIENIYFEYVRKEKQL